MKRIIVLFAVAFLLLASAYLSFSLTVLASETFTAEIVSINNDSFVVRGLEFNDINHRSDFRFTVGSSTFFMWHNSVISAADLSEGDLISVTYISSVSETDPAGIDNILKIVLLDDKK